MLSFSRVAQVLALGVSLLCEAQALLAQSQTGLQTPASIIAQVREATGGDGWNHVAEFRAEGTMLLGGKEGTFKHSQDLLTGSNVIRTQVPALDVKEGHATEPVQDWEQDNFGYVKLKPGGKNAGEIDDLYISRNGWWLPNFGGASVSLPPQASANGSTYDLCNSRCPAAMVLPSGSTAIPTTSNASPTPKARPTLATIAGWRVGSFCPFESRLELLRARPCSSPRS
ncbi:MAG: hypothetical protein WBF04_02250 [Candidatus Sulfotelmatobacter sp.]